MILLGSHIGLKAPDYFLGSVREAISYGENCFMVYTGAPQSSFRQPLSTLKLEEGKSLLQKVGIDPSQVIIHAPYIINLGCDHKPESFAFAKSFLTQELKRVESFGAKYLVLHPGSYLDGTLEEGIETLAKALDEVLSADGTSVVVCLETMAGKGHEIGSRFEELAKVIELCSHKDRLGVCLDTCHIHDAGMDLSKFDEILDNFDKTVGLSYLKVIHLNDSKSKRGSHKDRHENLGYGMIGFNLLNAIAHNSRIESIPKVLETPWVNEKPPYAKEVSMLRESSFEDNWRENL